VQVVEYNAGLFEFQSIAHELFWNIKIKYLILINILPMFARFVVLPFLFALLISGFPNPNGMSFAPDHIFFSHRRMRPTG
jgi:hypothetical protein